ncbi:MAG: hypothetical protein ACE5G0_15465 [Rhodothermales bacterium]
MFGRFFATVLLTGLLLAFGCEVTETLTSEPAFGDPYTLADASIPTAIAPRLDVDGLHVTVQYSGGCLSHQFKVLFTSRGDTTEIWLHHDGNGDRCEAYLTETLTLSVPSSVLDTENVVLLAPGGAVVQLR